MEKNKIIEARISCKNKVAAIIAIVLSLVAISLYLLISYISEIEYETYKGVVRGEVSGAYNILGDKIFDSYDSINELSKGFHPIKCMYDIICNVGREASPTTLIFIFVCLCLIIAICIIFGILYSKVVAKKCSIIIENTGVIGTRVKFFSNKEIKLPIEKIDSITVQNGILDKLYGGKTIAIRSSSGLIKFPWVQNAQEFLDATLAGIQKYKELVSTKSEATPAVPVSDEFEKVKKLKELQQQGLLTEEEFEAKKKQLLGL